MKSKINQFFIITVLFSIALVSCKNQAGSNENKTTDSTATPNKTDVAPFTDNSYNKAARFIAGLNQLSPNEYSEWEKKPEWIAYKTQMDSAWGKLQASRFSVMEKFYQENIGEFTKSEENVYYPFSGPDFLNIYQVYPHGSSYVMAGLEPVGAIPAPLTMTGNNELKNNLQGFSKGFRTVKEWGYYVTSYMSKDLNLTKLKGVIPIYYLFMVRMGCSIEKVELLSLDEAGKANVVDGLPNDKMNMRGCRVTFRHADNKVASLTYFEGNLEDMDSKGYGHSFIKNYESYVRANVKNANAYLKAASYLLYNETFSKSLYLLLDISKTMLTDESGVPYDKIDRNKWKISLFGKYYPPTKDFPWIKQPALKGDYIKDSANIKQIPFFTGYHRNLGQSNLQFYIKR